MSLRDAHIRVLLCLFLSFYNLFCIQYQHLILIYIYFPIQSLILPNQANMFIEINMQITSDKGSLQKHCWLPKELSLTSDGQSVCLRLNKLSLTRMGFAERLLWVKMLDLSHNELQSVAGSA